MTSKHRLIFRRERVSTWQCVKMRALGPGYTAEVDTVNEQRWCQMLQEFDDANIYQSWPYAAVISGRRYMSHLILRKNGDITAVAQARIAKLPFIERRYGIRSMGTTLAARGQRR